MPYQSKLQPIHCSVLVTVTWVSGCLVYSPVQRVSATLWCFQTVPGLPGCKTHCTLQFDWLHKPFAAWKSLRSLSLCLDHLHAPHWELPVESTPRNDRFSSTGERGVAQQPLSSSHVKQDVQWLTWKDMQKGTVTQRAASPNTAMILEVSKVKIIINEVECSHKACRTTAPGSKWVTGI